MHPLTELWKRYNEVRMAGDKMRANGLLQDIISYLKTQDKTFSTAFVDSLCKRVLPATEILDNNGTAVSANPERIQHPLFKSIILPVLADGYLKGNALYIKWIAQFEQFFFSDNEMTQAFLQQLNIEGFFSASFFLEKSLSIDQNQETSELLLKLSR